MKFVRLLTALTTLVLILTSAFSETVNLSPRFIIQITVDQLRGSLAGR